MSMISRIKSEEEIASELEVMCRGVLVEHHVDIDVAVLKEIIQTMLYDRVVKDLKNRLADWSSPSLLGLHAQLEQKEEAIKLDPEQPKVPKPRQTRSKKTTLN